MYDVSLKYARGEYATIVALWPPLLYVVVSQASYTHIRVKCCTHAAVNPTLACTCVPDSIRTL